jgi:transcriptional regulator with XRE-family HTH domain
MYTHARHLADPEIRELRCMGGRWLKELREKRGLSQRGLAALVGAEYYTFISQLETGRGRIPPDHYLEWAAALDVPPAEFVREIMRYYDPVTHGILFGNPPAPQHPAREARAALTTIDNPAAIL